MSLESPEIIKSKCLLSSDSYFLKVWYIEVVQKSLENIPHCRFMYVCIDSTKAPVYLHLFLPHRIHLHFVSLASFLSLSEKYLRFNSRTQIPSLWDKCMRLFIESGFSIIRPWNWYRAERQASVEVLRVMDWSITFTSKKSSFDTQPRLRKMFKVVFYYDRDIKDPWWYRMSFRV